MTAATGHLHLFIQRSPQASAAPQQHGGLGCQQHGAQQQGLCGPAALRSSSSPTGAASGPAPGCGDGQAHQGGRLPVSTGLLGSIYSLPHAIRTPPPGDCGRQRTRSPATGKEPPAFVSPVKLCSRDKMYQYGRRGAALAPIWVWRHPRSPPSGFPPCTCSRTLTMGPTLLRLSLQRHEHRGD